MALSAILARKTGQRIALFAAMAPLGLVLLFILMRHIAWGLLAIPFISMLVSFVVGTGTQTTINMTITACGLLLGAWLLRMLTLDRQVRLLPSGLNAPALVFILVTTFSLVAGWLPWFSFAASGASLFSQVGGWLLYALPVGLLLLAGNHLDARRGLPYATWIFLALGALYLAARFMPGLGYFTRFFTGSGQTAMFFTWLAALAFAQALWNVDLRLRWRFALAALALAGFTGMFLRAREWASGWFPMLVALAVLLWLRSWRLGLLFTLLGSVALLLFFPGLLDSVWSAGQQYSFETRFATWPVMWELFKLSPVLGLGPSNYYHYTSYFPLLGYYIKFNSHNQYWDILAQTGLLGMGAFLWLVLACLRSAWRLRVRLPQGFGRAYAYAALAGLLATLAVSAIGDWFLPFTYNIGFNGFRSAAYAWFFLGGLIVLEQTVKVPDQPA
ncbi:MAG TPA: O-antigen ligase family protein [Anaerolineales bacterium]|nr:O-antigen ligase family protein [Anaerolineales bacterium]